jgi:sugar lactone lactonase YvrE
VVGVVTGSLPAFVCGVAGDGDLLQVTTTLGEVHAYDPVRRTTRVRASGLSGLGGIAVGPDGGIVVAESDAGRVLVIDKADTVTVLAEGLDHPVGVAMHDNGTCYVSEDRLAQVIRLNDDGPVTVADGLGTPHGLAIAGDDLFTIDVEHGRLLRIPLSTGQIEVDAEQLPVGLPPAINRAEPATDPGVADRPAPFADIAVASDGSLLVSANGEGSVLRLSRTHDPATTQENQ